MCDDFFHSTGNVGDITLTTEQYQWMFYNNLLPSMGDVGLDVELVTFGWNSGSHMGELDPYTSSSSIDKNLEKNIKFRDY